MGMSQVCEGMSERRICPQEESVCGVPNNRLHKQILLVGRPHRIAKYLKRFLEFKKIKIASPPPRPPSRPVGSAHKKNLFVGRFFGDPRHHRVIDAGLLCGAVGAPAVTTLSSMYKVGTLVWPPSLETESPVSSPPYRGETREATVWVWAPHEKTTKFGLKILARRARILIPNFRCHILRLIVA